MDFSYSKIEISLSVGLLLTLNSYERSSSTVVQFVQTKDNEESLTQNQS